MAKGDTKTNQYLDIAANGTRADLPAARGCCNTRTQDLIVDVADRIITEEETRAREDAILQGEIDEIKNNPDVYDIVPTYAALQEYDTSGLTDKDIIRVLSDETHDGASTYYRWSATAETFTYIGEVGDYYTKTQVDTLLDGKQDELTAGENITIADESGALVISADSSHAIIELTSDDYNWPLSGTKKRVNPAFLSPGTYINNSMDYLPILIGGVQTSLYRGDMFTVSSMDSMHNVVTFLPNGTGRWSSDDLYYTDGAIYRVVKSSGDNDGSPKKILYTTSIIDSLNGTSAEHALSAKQGKNLKEMIDGRVITNAGAPTTSTVGTVGQLLEDTTNGKLYVCTDVTGGVYTWEEAGASVYVLTDQEYNALWSNPNQLNAILSNITTGTGV